MQATPDQIFLVAQKYHKEGNLKQAETLYKAVLSVKPLHADAWHMLGLSVFAQGRPMEAVENIKKAIELDKYNYEYQNNLGEVYRRAGMLEEAENHLKASISLKADNTDAYSNLALIYKARGDMDMAKLFFSKALQCDPKNINTLLNVGSMYQVQG